MQPHPHKCAASALQNRNVCFLIGDAYVPQPAEILTELHGRDLLEGKVIDFSDRGSDRNAFAVIAVDGLTQPVVVPTAKILAVGDP